MNVVISENGLLPKWPQTKKGSGPLSARSTIPKVHNPQSLLSQYNEGVSLKLNSLLCAHVPLRNCSLTKTG